MFGIRKRKAQIKKERPTLTYGIIGICTVIFLVELAGHLLFGDTWVKWLFDNFGFSLKGLIEGKWWTLFTSIFVHATPDHLILNMIALFFFGRVVEEGLYWKRYLLIFFASALAGEGAISLASLLGLMPASIPTVGASAAIFGIMATAVLVKPFEFVVYPYLIPLPLILVAVLYTLYNVIAFIAVIATGVSTSVAYASHFGGLAAGIYFGLKYEGRRRGLLVLALVIAILIAIPVIWSFLQSLEILNYITVTSRILGA